MWMFALIFSLLYLMSCLVLMECFAGMGPCFFSLAYDVFQYFNTDMMASLANMRPAAGAGDLVKPRVLCWGLLVVDH